MTRKKPTRTTTSLTNNESQKSKDEVIISAPTTPITKASSGSTNVDTPPPMGADGEAAAEAPSQAPQIDVFNREFCGELWGSLVFNRLAVTRGEHWKLSDAEKATLGETSAAVLNRYVGAYLGDYPELAAFLISAVVIAAPRLMKDGKIKREARELVKGAINKVQSEQQPVLSDSVTSA